MGAERSGRDAGEPAAAAPPDATRQRGNQGLSQPAREPRGSDAQLNGHPTVAGSFDWQQYEPAIRRWESIAGRPAPCPIERGTRGQPRLASRFVEWLMGLPAGYVTGLDLPRSAELRALGNGVVPQQAETALWQLVIQARAYKTTEYEGTTSYGTTTRT